MDNLQVNTCIFEPIYRVSIYRSAIYNSKLDYRKCQVFLLDKYPIIQVVKMQEIQVTMYYIWWGIVYILNYSKQSENHVMCSTHTSHSKIQLKISLTPYIINCVKFSHNSPKLPKITSVTTSIKSLYFLVKLNFLTI